MHCTDARACARLLICGLFALLAACASTDRPAQGNTGEIGSRPPIPNPYLAQAERVPAQAQQQLQAARQLYDGGDLAAAETALIKMTETWPTLSGLWLNLGIVQQKIQRPDAAEQSLRSAVAANELNVYAWNQLAALLRDAGRFAEAQQCYEAALAHWPDYADAHRNLGILFDLYLHQPQLALKHYRAAQQISAEEDRQLAGWIVDLERRL